MLPVAKPVSKESVAIAGECLRFLALLQTFAKPSECQRGFMILLVNAIIMVFLASEDSSSQEVRDLRSSAVRLVSHLAQVSSSAVHFKDVLLSMPATDRQHLQVIRVYVAQVHNAVLTKSATPLEIKLPLPKDSLPVAVSSLPTEARREKNFPPDDHDDDDDEDDDNWDTFQSFPASVGVGGNDPEAKNAAEEPAVIEQSVSESEAGTDGIREFSTDRIEDNDAEVSADDLLSAKEEGSVQVSVAEKDDDREKQHSEAEDATKK